MKIAIIGSRGYPYVYSGYETLVKELGERLVKKNVSVRVYCHRSLFKERPRMHNGIELVYVPAIETKILSQLTHSFLSMIHCCFSSVDAIFVVNTANGPFGLLARIFRKPTAINLDGLEWKRPKWQGLGARYFYFSSWLSTRFYDYLVNDSKAMREIYLNQFGCDSEVIAYGANKRFSESPELIKRWNLEQGGYYLIVGRLIPDNNADIIVESFIKSKSKRKLVIVGDVPYEDLYASKIKSQGDRDDRLLFTGYVTDQTELAELYHNAYCYVHGHEYGGTNPTMLKALAYGCAIMALDTPFNREMLQNGDHGEFFHKSIPAIATVFDELDEDQEKVKLLKKTAREGITADYDWDNVTEKYLDLFQRMTQP